MRKILIGAIIVLLALLAIQYFGDIKTEKERLEADTELIQEQLRNVGKLVVTEASYAQVYTYENSKKLYFDLLSARKKALIVVNAEARVSYDLSKVKTKIDPKAKTVTITSIPEPELSIDPNIRYYDIEQDYLNQFEASDYNKIRERIEKSLRGKIENSPLMENAQNRLVSELQKIYILTSSMGWTLRYGNNPIEAEKELNGLFKL